MRKMREIVFTDDDLVRAFQRRIDITLVTHHESRVLRRLLKVYARRLHSNLMSGLSALLLRSEAERVAETTAALIDGLYIRRALKDGVPDATTAAALIEDYLETKLADAKAD